MNIRLSANPSRTKRIHYERQLKLLKFFDVISSSPFYQITCYLQVEFPEFFMKGDIENLVVLVG